MEATGISNQNLWPKMLEVQSPAGVRAVLREAPAPGELEGARVPAPQDRGGQAQ